MKSMNFFNSFSFFAWVYLFPFSLSLTINTYEIRDLEFNTSYFQQESQLWTVGNAFTSSNTSQCSGTWLLGGYGITGNGGIFMRKYRSLPSHDMIYFSADTWIIDLAESRDLFTVYFDDILVKTYNSNGYYPGAYPSSYLCGGLKTDFSQISIRGKVVHNSTELTIKIVSLFNSAIDTFSIGFRNLNLLFQTASIQPTSACNFVSAFYSSLPSCLCSKGFYDPPGGAGCSACNSVCRTCSGPSDMNCTSCKSGYSFNGQTCFKCDVTCSQCKGAAPTDCIRCNSGSYLYWNGTCQQSCNPTLLIRTEGDFFFCDLPCNISTEYFYQNNKTCLSDCSAPWIQHFQGEVKVCSFPCASSEYLYWNGSCSPSCPLSFQSSDWTQKYCKFHCSQEEYLYWNSSCLPSCASPLVQTLDSESYKFCNFPCGTGQVLFSNKSCGFSCEFQLNITADGISLCNFPCALNEFYYQNETCLLSCPSPFVPDMNDAEKNLCNLPCPSEEYYILSTKTCATECPSTLVSKQDGILKYCDIYRSSVDKSQYVGVVMSKVIDAFGVAGNVVRPEVLGSAFKTSLVKLVKYVRFIKVPILKDILEILDSNISSIYSVSINFYYPMPMSLQESFQKHDLPSIFEEQIGQSSYLVNNWNTLTTFLVLFMFGTVFFIIEKLVKKCKQRRISIQIMKRVRTISHWNFLLCIIFNTYDDLTLFAILEFQTIKFDSFASTLSFLTCIFVSLIALYLLGMVYVVNKQLIKMKTQVVDTNSKENSEISFYNKWKHYQVTYAGYKNTSFISQGYLFWFTCRIIALYIIVGFLYDFPLAQTIIFTAMSLLMLGYLIKARPVKDPFSYYVSLVFESLVLIMNISLLLLAIFDKTKRLTFVLQENLSYTILVLNIMIDILGNSVMWMYIIITMRAAYITSKKYGLSGKTNRLSVLVIAYQSPGMDFHELSNHDLPDSNTSSTQPNQSQSHKHPAPVEETNIRRLSQIRIPYFVKLDSAKTLNTTQIADTPRLDTQMTPITEEDPQDSTVRRLVRVYSKAKTGKTTPKLDLERGSSLESDFESLSSRRNMLKSTSKTLVYSVTDKEENIQSEIPEDCQDIHESRIYTEQDRGKSEDIASDITISTNLPNNELILKNNVRIRLKKDDSKNKEAKDENLKTLGTLTYNFVNKTKAKQRNYRKENFQNSIALSRVETNNSETTYQHPNTENTNRSFEPQNLQLSEQVLEKGPNHKSQLFRLFTGNN